jgi:adenosine kinase
MTYSHLNRVADVAGATLGIVAPDGRDGMLQHAQDLAAAGVPFVFDPGQGLPMFSGDDLMNFMRSPITPVSTITRRSCCVTGLAARLSNSLPRSKRWSSPSGVPARTSTRQGRCHEIPCVKADAVVDPTGCGDAYRSGLLYGIAAGWDWEKTGRLAAVMGAIKIAHRGGQNHRPFG